MDINIACWHYDRVRGLADKRVQPEGINLNFTFLEPHEVFARQVKSQEFDVSDMSLSYYTHFRSRGDDAFIAIPIFLSRTFRHSCIYINTESTIEKPEDLRGKRVGIPGYYMTAGVWVRGLLQHDFGVKPTDMTWYYSREDVFAWRPPQELEYHKIPLDKTLDGMLVSGEIQALVAIRKPESFLNGSPKVARLFPNFKQVEMEYYTRTKLFPIMHTLVIRRELYEREPWIAGSLYKAFVEARDLCYAEVDEIGSQQYTLVWLLAEVEEERRVFGDDYWSYGLAKNRGTVETLVKYSHEQGLARRIVSIEELFAEETLDT